MAVGEHKAVAIDPVRIFGIKGHKSVEKDMAYWGHAHRGARMAGICLSSSINLQYALCQRSKEALI
jgi:hypothetical protein